MRRWILAGLALCFVGLLAAAALVAVYVNNVITGPGLKPEETTLVIPRGSGLDAITERLHEAGLIENKQIFKLFVRYRGLGRDLKAGEFVFPARASLTQVVDTLALGQSLMRRITIPEGLTSQQIVTLVRDTPGMEGEIGTVPPEGSLLPETYDFHYGDERQWLVERMQQAMRDVIDELWAARAEELPIATPEEAVVLASIIEKETGVADERAHIAGVFVNRLRKGMKLQSDPTVIYGITLGKAPLGRSLTRKDLRAETAHNTYTIDGLPPTPIANPGRKAIEAALNPLPTKNIFFVADGTGGHAFAETLKQHNANVKKWRQYLKNRKKK